MLEFIEEALDEVSFAVEREIAGPRHLTICFWRNHRGRGFLSSVRRGIDRSLARRFFSRPGAMLVRADNGGIDHHVFIVVIARQHLENTLENPALGPPAEALVDNFPISEALRKIAPRDARSISEKNGLHEQPVVRRGAANMAFTT